MTILVTGAAGYVGSNLVRMLVQEGKDVVASDMMRPGSESVLTEMRDQLRFVVANVLDLGRLVSIIKQFRVEGIIHTAVVQAQEANDRPLEGLRVNIEGTANILEAARLMNLRRVVCCSSSSAVGDHADISKPIKETDIKLPLSGLYSVANLTREGLCYNYRRIFSVDAVAVRLTRGYGPGFTHFDMPVPLPILVRDAVAGKPIKIERGGETVMDYTYVKDQVLGVKLAYEANTPRSWIYNVSFGQLRSVFQVVEVLKKVFPTLPIEVGPGLWGETAAAPGAVAANPLTYRVVQRPPYDITLAKQDLGYDPRYPIDKGIPAYVAWLQKRQYL